MAEIYPVPPIFATTMAPGAHSDMGFAGVGGALTGAAGAAGAGVEGAGADATALPAAGLLPDQLAYTNVSRWLCRLNRNANKLRRERMKLQGFSGSCTLLVHPVILKAHGFARDRSWPAHTSAA